MEHLKSKFTFFKAGQGSFYGGRIWLQDTKEVFTVVYDCGTSPFIAGNNQSLNNEINHFKNRRYYFQRNNNEIELLFISHLDYDHVSGLKRLLTEFNVKNIILPYIKKEHRQFFLTSISNDNDPENNLTIDEYISFIDSPNKFINSNSEKTKQFYIKTDSKNEIEYFGYDSNNDKFENIYPQGNPSSIDELSNQANVSVYENNLQFFIKKNWEFTTYVKDVNEAAIEKLHSCLKKKLNKEITEVLSLEDIKSIVTINRKKAHKCYTDCIGEINSHGLVLLHGPINYKHLSGEIYPNCELNYVRNNYRYYNRFYKEYHFNNDNKRSMLGTLLLGDISINPNNNPINFPQAFKDKLLNVHVVQIPHHGSSKNWDFTSFDELNIGESINRWENHVITVCNFGYGNKYGHPSHQVLKDLRSTIFLNSQFSRININYDIIF